MPALPPAKTTTCWLIRTPLRYALTVFLTIGALYYVAGRIALLLLTEAEGVAVFWPASGIAAGAMVALGRRSMVPIALAVAAATIAANLEARTHPTAIFAACNAIECVVFAVTMRMVDKQRAYLESLGSIAAFLVAAAVAPAVAAAPAALAVQWLGMSKAPFLAIWFTWFQSDALGIVAVAPVLLTMPSMLRGSLLRVTLIAGGLGASLAALAAYFGFSLAYGGVVSIMTPMILLFPIFLGLASRTPAFFSALGVFLVAFVMVILALSGGGRFGESTMPLPDRLAAAQVALLTTCCAVLTLSAMFARVNNAAAALQAIDQRLQLALAAGRMYAFDDDLATGTVHRFGGLIGKLGLPAVGTIDDYFEALRPSEKPAFLDLINQQSPAEPQVARLLHMRAADGQELAIEYRSVAEYDCAGNAVRLRGTCVDVTELEKRTEQLGNALQAGRVFAFEYDTVKKTARRSDNAAEILGVPLELARSSRNLFNDNVHPDDKAALAAYGRRSSPADAYRSGNFRFVRPDGAITLLEVRSTAIFGGDGRISGYNGVARDVTEQTKASERQAMLIKELDHRVKNALARMAVVIELSRDGHQTLDEYVKVIQGRIASMARTQERLSGNKWTGVGVAMLVDDELASYRKADNCAVEGPDIVLEPDTAQALAFTLHELATNAAKYGGLSSPGGKVAVEWSVVAGETSARVLKLAWREVTDGGIQQPTRESYGLNTIRNLLRYEQKATVALDFKPTGLLCEIALPLPAPAAVGSIGPGGIPLLNPEAAAPARQ